MTWIPKIPSASDDHGTSTIRRLLLCKRLYLHALNHSQQSGDIDKIIAVHNFHNSIEIFLKAVVTYYDLRLSKPINPDFESLMRDIDEDFKRRNIEVPYRQDLRNLNTIRNLVQHSAHEPESSTMDEWRVITHKFLKAAYSSYFGLDFDEFSQTEIIEDESIRKLLNLSLKFILDGRIKLGVEVTKLTLDWVIEDVVEFGWGYHPEMTVYSFSQDDSNDQIIMLELARRLAEVERSIAFLARDINPVEYTQFLSLTPQISVLAKNHYQVFWNNAKIPDTQTAQWLYNFAVSAIITLQSRGNTPRLEWAQEVVEQIIVSDGKDFFIEA